MSGTEKKSFPCFENTPRYFCLRMLVFLFQHKDAYQAILDGVKGGAKEKRLAAQFIPKFFKHFPELADSAINAQLDLCEDEDVSVRIRML